MWSMLHGLQRQLLLWLGWIETRMNLFFMCVIQHLLFVNWWVSVAIYYSLLHKIFLPFLFNSVKMCIVKIPPFLQILGSCLQKNTTQMLSNNLCRFTSRCNLIPCYCYYSHTHLSRKKWKVSCLFWKANSLKSSIRISATNKKAVWFKYF